jgi:hypothetical protein
LGDPLRLYATLANYPGSSYVGPTRNYILFEYPGNSRASLLVNHHTIVSNDSQIAKFYLEGTKGDARD